MYSKKCGSFIIKRITARNELRKKFLTNFGKIPNYDKKSENNSMDGGCFVGSGPGLHGFQYDAAKQFWKRSNRDHYVGFGINFGCRNCISTG